MKRIAILLVLLVAGGCGDDEPGVTPPPCDDGGVPFPDTGARFMSNYRNVHEERDFDIYRALLADNFVMVLQDETMNRFPDLGWSLDRGEDLRCMERMFSGEEVRDPSGELVPGVLNVSFDKMVQVEDWQDVLVPDPVPGEVFAPFDVDILFDRGQAFNQISVQGRLVFYLTRVTEEVCGEERTGYRLSGLVDHTTHSNKATAMEALGSLKGMYR